MPCQLPSPFLPPLILQNLAMLQILTLVMSVSLFLFVSVLRQRLDDRVDDMMARGLVEQLADFHRQHNKQRLESADTR